MSSMWKHRASFLLVILFFAALGVWARQQPQVKTIGPGRFSKHDLGNSGDGILKAILLPGSTAAISSSANDRTSIWNLADGKESKRFSGESFRFQDIALSSDARSALTPTPSAAVRYWDLATGKNIRILAGAKVNISTVALSENGALAAAAGQDTAIHVWALADGTSVRIFPVDVAQIRIAFEFGSQRLVSVQADGQVCVRNTQNQGPPACIAALPEPATTAVFSKDGRLVLIEGQYGTLVLWDVDRASLVRTLTGTTQNISSLALSADGNLALSGGTDKTVRLWNLRTGQQIAHTTGSGSYVSSVAFSSDGTLALFGCDDGKLTLWRLE
ncbi:MAG TPA: hypothetical protein VFC39_10340 [Acidobacteriaceae bacterium]|nr:hypothetical protein [Acidobacteriaceae bacterium]